MKSILGKFILSAGALVLAFTTVPGSQAECGLQIKLAKPMAWHPPAHVVLATYLFGASKPSRKGPTEEQTRAEMEQLSAFTGQRPCRMPEHLKQMVRQAEDLKKKRRGA